ncbi:MAG: asparagine synthase (glutamine-hydrolyzing) [Flavobacteriales bacterium]|nr:asparagine synthase (glutamine-hydrolyzing) [Flavobacteriales bacterium]
MCGIGGVIDINQHEVEDLEHKLNLINTLQAHRGPDENGLFTSDKRCLGLAHQRLSIIDPSTGQQPMSDDFGLTVVFNGAIYNHIELRKTLEKEYQFRSHSDTETIIAAYRKWGEDCLSHLRGMFAFAIWDEKNKVLFCARDRFGIKPFYYTKVDNKIFFASEVKAILPFIDNIEPNQKALKEYLYFQLYLGEETLFNNINQLKPAHFLKVENGQVHVKKYWEIYYDLDFEHTSNFFERKVRELLFESVDIHLRSDVPVGSYVSGGVDSSLIAGIANNKGTSAMNAFTGKFDEGELFDESQYAKLLCEEKGLNYYELTMNSGDFINSFEKIIYHLDYPLAGPGSFPQFMISELVSKHNKVVLGGQGGDEIFGGYTRYLIAYFEQCIRGAIDGTLNSGNFVVTYESIIPNLVNLRNYKPLMKQFWKKGLFEDLDRRYFRLINRAPNLKSEVNWDELSDYDPFDIFASIFNGSNVGKESYFDKMTHFDFKVLLPALLQVEDRMSMAHGVEARVPFMDHKLVEFVATAPADIKFKNGELKRLLKKSFKNEIPNAILNRKDKMGFPVPLNKWMQGEIREYILDIFSSKRAKERPFVNTDVIIDSLTNEGNFGRKTWGLLSLEMWYQQFFDNFSSFKKMASSETARIS